MPLRSCFTNSREMRVLLFRPGVFSAFFVLLVRVHTRRQAFQITDSVVKKVFVFVVYVVADRDRPVMELPHSAVQKFS